MAKSLSKSDILGMVDRRPEAVYVPAWDAEVYIRPMSGRDRDELEAWQRDNPDGVGMRAQIVARCLCDADGRPMDWDDDELAQLGERDGTALDQIVGHAARLSSLTKDAVEAIAKNSPAAPSGGSG